MGSAFTHAFIAGSLGAGLLPAGLRTRFIVLGMIGAVLPDIDVLAFLFDLPDGHPLGHRGFTHSLSFAALYATSAMLLALPDRVESRSRRRVWSFLFLSTAAHGLLDALTDGRRGIAFLSPFSNARIYSPWQPLPAAPIDLERFFGPYGLTVMAHEIVWIWLPTIVLSLLLSVVARRRLESAARGAGGDRPE